MSWSLSGEKVLSRNIMLILLAPKMFHFEETEFKNRKKSKILIAKEDAMQLSSA